MAPKNSKLKVSNGEVSVRYIVPIIGLERPEKPTLTKGEYVVLKCRTNPTEEGSSTYDLPIPYYSTGTPEEWLRFERNLEKAFNGQNLTTGPQQYACLRRLLPRKSSFCGSAESYLYPLYLCGAKNATYK